ncbi:hypothetical protein EXIGLDRAFT_761593 [Exidia glandulosa HHB12029]|uniref:Transmembrane protein n=1 Tax=Exidia glandulosa HHB12029 TaxID=1314781 RepID=A0A165NBI4_EXIGL|nr:hypothetical protein EXIGLDRAFT_761593 [Exidia glandulosa HHB12029]
MRYTLISIALVTAATTSLAAVVPPEFLALIQNQHTTVTNTPPAQPTVGFLSSEYVSGTLVPELFLPGPTTTTSTSSATPTVQVKTPGERETDDFVYVLIGIYASSVILVFVCVYLRKCTARRLARERRARGIGSSRRPSFATRPSDDLLWPELDAKHSIYSGDAWANEMRQRCETECW